LPEELEFVQDRIEHGVIGLACAAPLVDYCVALASTQGSWVLQ
jgi:hypothetical protein